MAEYKPLICKCELDATELLFRTGDLFRKKGQKVSPFTIQIPQWVLTQKEEKKEK